jgi:hypothetical protein
MTFDPDKNLEDAKPRTVRSYGTGNAVLAAGGQPDW